MKRRTLFASLLGFFGIAARPKPEPDLSGVIALLRSQTAMMDLSKDKVTGLRGRLNLPKSIRENPNRKASEYAMRHGESQIEFFHRWTAELRSKYPDRFPPIV